MAAVWAMGQLELESGARGGCQLGRVCAWGGHFWRWGTACLCVTHPEAYPHGPLAKNGGSHNREPGAQWGPRLREGQFGAGQQVSRVGKSSFRAGSVAEFSLAAADLSVLS